MFIVKMNGSFVNYYMVMIFDAYNIIQWRNINFKIETDNSYKIFIGGSRPIYIYIYNVIFKRKKYLKSSDHDIICVITTLMSINDDNKWWQWLTSWRWHGKSVARYCNGHERSQICCNMGVICNALAVANSPLCKSMYISTD